jgi:hypothetical protein
MAAAPALQVLTANRLRDGEVVYARANAWVEGLARAELFATKEAADAALKAAEKDVADRVVVNPYLFPVKEDGGAVRPIEEREIIRAAGPSVRLELGKQALDDRGSRNSETGNRRWEYEI